MPQAYIEELADQAIASLSREDARHVAARVDEALEADDLTDADRGILLASRAVAGQHFEPPDAIRAQLEEAIALLENTDEKARLMGVIAGAAGVSFMSGDINDALELGVRAMLLVESCSPDDVPVNVTGNLGVLFNEFSAFDVAEELSEIAYAEHDSPTSDGPALICAFNFARTLLESVWHRQEEPGFDSSSNLDRVRQLAAEILDGAPEGDAGATRPLMAHVLWAEAALLAGELEDAERHSGLALAVPEGSQDLLEGYAHLVAGMVARRRNRFDEALTFFNAAEDVLGTEIHRQDRLLAERAEAFARIGDYEAAYADAQTRAERATGRTVEYMGSIIGQIRARAVAEHTTLTLVETTDELTELSRRDGLTGVSSRGWFDACFTQRGEALGDLAIVMLDLDHFKAVNDDFSHLVGDEVLRRLGEILLGSCRDRDLVARYGGEEFVILPAEGDLIRAHELGERLRKTIESEPWHLIEDTLEVTASLGVAAGPARAGRDLLRAADDALYEAKESGRNCVIAQRLRPEIRRAS